VSLVSTHVRRHRGRLSVTYGTAAVENGLELLYPAAVGLAVDDLLDGRWVGVAVFAGIALFHTAISFARQRFDARSFNDLYAGLATDLVAQHRDRGVPTSTVAARSALAGEYVAFLERDVVASIAAGFAIVGSLIMLFLYDPILGVAAAAVALPVTLLNRRLVRRSRRIYRRLNDELEVEVTVIDRGSAPDVHRHFRILRGHWIGLSDAEATSWGAVEVIGTGLTVLALVRVTGTGAEAGIIFATIGYVWAYLTGFDLVPSVLQAGANLKDIRRRLDEAGA
jgi:ABC-type multidrug transport system fused ATPase/permease subunit